MSGKAILGIVIIIVAAVSVIKDEVKKKNKNDVQEENGDSEKE